MGRPGPCAGWLRGGHVDRVARRARRAGSDAPAYPPFTARPEHWLPGRVTLDASWDDIDAWLLVEGLSERSPRDRDRIPAVARALEILDTQGRRSRAGAGSERPPGAADHHGRGTR